MPCMPPSTPGDTKRTPNVGIARSRDTDDFGLGNIAPFYLRLSWMSPKANATAQEM